jgi:hypothetical protein
MPLPRSSCRLLIIDLEQPQTVAYSRTDFAFVGSNGDECARALDRHPAQTGLLFHAVSYSWCCGRLFGNALKL